jgi:hypothetical protein
MSGITLIMYAQSQNIWKPNNSKVCEQQHSKGLNMIAKIIKGYLCLGEENLGFNHNYMIYEL